MDAQHIFMQDVPLTEVLEKNLSENNLQKAILYATTQNFVKMQEVCMKKVNTIRHRISSMRCRTVCVPFMKAKAIQLYNEIEHCTITSGCRRV